MKLYAQAGYGPSEKINEGLSENIIQGAILSPKDMTKLAMTEKIQFIRGKFPKADVFIDPQFYVGLYAASPEINLGNIGDWDYFRHYTKSELEISRNIDNLLQTYFGEIADLNVTGVISPNIYISQSFDSREAVIAKNFIRQARNIIEAQSISKPLYASLVICREALQDQKEFEEFLNDITMIDERPDGFYVIVGSRSHEARSDIFHTDIIANWMMLNLSLSINGFEVINGYSDILTAFLGAVGGTAGATGWWSNLRTFSLDRYFPAGGGRLPVIRYLSNLLLNRITFAEKEAISAFIPDILNNLPHDTEYTAENNESGLPAPERAREILQSWEAINTLNQKLTGNDISKNLDECNNWVLRCAEAYGAIANRGLVLDSHSNNEHVEPLMEGLRKFREKTEFG
ncbi:MAG: hypothetical protein WC611_10375 [Candidatus Neomarinimicrobiota bacterium]|jgi:hypothetical protein